jgi:predicted RND superfamily exporter protein
MIVFADPAKPSRKFGTGAVAGVAVGGAVLMAVIVLLLYLFLCRRRSKSKQGSKSHPDFFSTGKEGKKKKHKFWLRKLHHREPFWIRFFK